MAPMPRGCELKRRPALLGGRPLKKCSARHAGWAGTRSGATVPVPCPVLIRALL